MSQYAATTSALLQPRRRPEQQMQPSTGQTSHWRVVARQIVAQLMSLIGNKEEKVFLH